MIIIIGEAPTFLYPSLVEKKENIYLFLFVMKVMIAHLINRDLMNVTVYEIWM